jgi:N-acetylmuramoyl-L-alanine amidase
VLAALAAASATLAAAPALPPRFEAGRSVDGRRIVAVRRGRADAPMRLLVTGSTHGTESAGHAIVARLRKMTPPDGVQVWTVRTFNPDGAARGTRQNARGVDLNRNFPYRWRDGGGRWDPHYPGPSPASEPETRAEMRLIRRLKPQVTIHYHQALQLVDLTSGADPGLVRYYARRTGLPARRLPYYRGTATSWQNRGLDEGSAFVVELSAGPLTLQRLQRHAYAALGTAAFLKAHGERGRATPTARRSAASRSAARRSAARRSAARRGTARRSAAAPKPRIVWSPIPFRGDRIRQMRSYARRHYGLDRGRLLDPKVIVEHFTATSSYGPAYNTFAANSPDVEFGERPGVCAHFIVDRDGTIHQLVRLKWMCRHTVGLNHVAFGVEHVGTSDGDVIGRRRQLAASLGLTRWLQDRYGIRDRDVIGHAESLSSPYHRERVRAMRNRTHGDMARATMRRYRRML